MTESILIVVALALVAGGGIIVIDALVIRKVRRIAKASGRLTFRFQAGGTNSNLLITTSTG